MVDQNRHVRLPEGISFGRNMLENTLAEWSGKGLFVQPRPFSTQLCTSDHSCHIDVPLWAGIQCSLRHQRVRQQSGECITG